MVNTLISHLKSILLLPFTVIIVFPLLLLYISNDFTTADIGPWNISLGLLIVSIGLFILLLTIASFKSIGKGTLAPWNPPKELVITGIYKYMRHPMISGVILTILGESILFQSLHIFIYGLILAVLNVFYLKYVEEPQLVKRFGNRYILYRKEVPCFILRCKIKYK